MTPEETKQFNFYNHLKRQRCWSEATFGPGTRHNGVVDHIRKELLEIEAVMEWIDVAILALDGAWRSGATPEQIIMALVGKQIKNEGRTWPDWKTMSPDAAHGEELRLFLKKKNEFIMSSLSDLFHEEFKDDMNPGNIIVSAVTKSNSIESIDKGMVTWSSNAAEQIEAAIAEMGYKLVKI